MGLEQLRQRIETRPQRAYYNKFGEMCALESPPEGIPTHPNLAYSFLEVKKSGFRDMTEGLYVMVNTDADIFFASSDIYEPISQRTKNYIHNPNLIPKQLEEFGNTSDAFMLLPYTKWDNRSVLKISPVLPSQAAKMHAIERICRLVMRFPFSDN